MSRQVGSPKGMKLRADKLFSQIIRSRGACQACGKTLNLQCAHVISRRFANTRCDEDNAFCLCAGCHMYYTDHPVEFGTFVLTLMDEADYTALTARSQRTTKVVWVDVVQRLKLRAQELDLVG